MWENIDFTENKRTLFNQGYDKEILIKGNVVTGATMAFRAIYKKLLLPIPSGCIHDAWIALMLTLVDKKGIFIDESLIFYRQHEAQQIGAKGKNQAVTDKQGRNFICSMDYIREGIRKAGLEHEFADTFYYRYVCDLMFLLRMCYSNSNFYKSPEDLKKMEIFLKERFSKISWGRILSNRHLKFSYKLKALRLKSGIYKMEKMVVGFFR